VAGTVAHSPVVSERVFARDADARRRLEGARWGVYLTVAELQLAAAAIAALPEQSITTRALEQRFRGVVHHASGRAGHPSTDEGGRG
jgi:hypothetical protein